MSLYLSFGNPLDGNSWNTLSPQVKYFEEIEALPILSSFYNDTAGCSQAQISVDVIFLDSVEILLKEGNDTLVQ